MFIHAYELMVTTIVVCLLVCSLKIKQNREENLARMKLLRKLHRERIALKRERALTDAAVKRARACKFE
nr:MAG TPA: hypothetical protein [Bacteriophage sp.]